MENMKKLTKVTAGILSFALALGAVSYIPAARPVGSVSAAGEDYEETLNTHDYYLEDVYITDVCTDAPDASLTVIRGDHGYYEPWSRNEFRLKFDLRMSYDQINKNLNLLEELDRGTIISLKIQTLEEYPKLDDFNDPEKSSYELSGTYKICDIVKVISPGIHYYGDINDDGVIDSFDLITYRKYVTKSDHEGLTDAMFKNADINKNNAIDDDDLKRVSDYILGNVDDFYDTEIGSLRLDNTVNVESSAGKVTDEAFAKAEMQFGVDLLKKCFDPTKEGEENLLISPMSISSALAMTANGADGNTREEMEKVLGNGLTLDQLNEYLAYYAANLPNEKKQKVMLANSIWFRDDPMLQVYDSFLETNKKYYNSEIYKSAFDDNTVDDVNSWVSKNTKGMIPSLLKHGDLKPTPEKIMMMMLINTLYFEADWMHPYDSSRTGTFTDLNGEEHSIQKMSSQESFYYDLGDADAFSKPYAGGEYSFIGILPKENDIISYVNNMDAEKISEGLKTYEDIDNIELYVTIPKFSYDYSKSLSKVLYDLGMSEAFDKENANFTKMGKVTTENPYASEDADLSETPLTRPLYIDDVIHKTKIEVTEKGTKAAAVTAVMMAAAGAMPVEKKKIYINLDRPFVYMIVDKNNTPLFIGVATNLKEN